MCVCCHPIYSGRQTCGRTSRGHTGGRPYRISPPSFCDACLIFWHEESFSRPFPSSTAKSILCTHESIVLHLSGMVFIYLFFKLFERKNPVRVTAPRFEPTSQRQKVSRLPTEPQGGFPRNINRLSGQGEVLSTDGPFSCYRSFPNSEKYFNSFHRKSLRKFFERKFSDLSPDDGTRTRDVASPLF